MKTKHNREKPEWKRVKSATISYLGAVEHKSIRKNQWERKKRGRKDKTGWRK
jgi:hypothetical protein